MPVVIVGGGPAGAATAIALAKHGIDAIVLETTLLTAFKPGETLPPNAGAIIGQLGLQELLDADEHHACTNNTVIWGKPEPETRYFFSETNGNGWHLDRPFFEQQLKNKAIEKGVSWLQGWKCEGWTPYNNHLEVTVFNRDGDQRIIKAGFLVDASGRAATLARKKGLKRNSLDKLTGYYAELKNAAGKLKGTTFIEAVCEGWWYASPMKNGDAIVTFMTDADLHQTSSAAVPQWLSDQLKQTCFLNQYMDQPDQFFNIHVKPASTSFLEKPSGDRWLAVGDAICTYDPITSHGLTAAMGGAIYAATAIKSYLDGNPEAMAAYSYVQQEAFNNYLSMLQNHYSIEQRWNNSQFWKRRH
ncbi:FAD-dependent monooxygenase [Pedobacter sp. L105]|uniref:FAD-dependent monooxygenase n=1 Tax=Pedobacter sp. L105 TaxID=1641871 RepID=UPI00131AC92D|nr:FAD-dependent monooxygenase [Pedobacter sp. L105]